MMLRGVLAGVAGLSVVLGCLAGPAQAASTQTVSVTCTAGSGWVVQASANPAVGDTLVVNSTGCLSFATVREWATPSGGSYTALSSAWYSIASGASISFLVQQPMESGNSIVVFSPNPGPAFPDQTYVVHSGASTPTAPVPACSDVMFIGARGSGQAQGDLNSPGGPEMERLYAQAASLITGAGKTISARQVGPSYSAPGVETIAANMGSDKKKWLPQLAQNLAGYLRAEKVGVTELDIMLTKQAALCPNQRFILAGYSQGAMVVNDVLLAAARARPAWLSAVKSVVLVANPERVKSEKYVEFGTASRGDGVCSVTAAASQSLTLRGCWIGGPSVLGGSFTDRVISVCLKDDIVCSTQQWASDYAFAAANAAARKSALNLGTSTHSLYKHRKEMDTAGRRAAQLALR